MVTIDQVINNQDGTVTVNSHDTSSNTYENIIGLSNTPTPTDPLSTSNMAFYLAYVESTIPPLPVPIYTGG
jgi:hypothetical protein